VTGLQSDDYRLHPRGAGTLPELQAADLREDAHRTSLTLVLTGGQNLTIDFHRKMLRSPASAMAFKIGDPVRWVRAVPETHLKHRIGVITGVLSSDQNNEAFHMYDVRFDADSYTLYGTQLEPADAADYKAGS
jgi:hypothetical protein